jgi:hypothetical protein
VCATDYGYVNLTQFNQEFFKIMIQVGPVDMKDYFKSSGINERAICLQSVCCKDKNVMFEK